VIVSSSPQGSRPLPDEISPPYATEAGTERYLRRFANLPPGHFNQRYGLWMSSIGLGTYLGEADEATSAGYVQSIQAALARGCNVIDTAINYRHMRSERDVGAALAAMFASGELRRDEVVVCTKGGYIAFDGKPPADRLRDIQQRFYATGIAEPAEIVGHVHCMTPAYLSNQIGVSLANLGLDTIDVYYLHNPETQLDYVTPEEFKRRLRAAFERLEEEVAYGRIRFYGVATWHGLRAGDKDRAYLPLFLLVKLAREVGGEGHHFRFLQFPYSLGMLEALTKHNQLVERNGANGQTQRYQMQVLAAAVQYGLVSVCSAGLAQTQIFGRIPTGVRRALGAWESDAQYAIQFNRSTPGVTTTLIGSRRVEHVVENLAVAQHSPLLQEEFFRLFQRGR
jgi:aryl-alcohol dehydrogenase-like predicted oxidoreductase